ncbi:MAG: DMT family transporter [Chitinophagaceae bacterium]|nr:DMT family transporter [Chitinophagaceae bacterium]
MWSDPRYKGIFFMLLAALGFSVMGGAAKALKESFSAGQLVFYRNAIGLVFLLPGLLLQPPVQPGGKPLRLAFRGLMGTLALYTLLYCILHIPLGTAMSYNLTSALFIALFSYFLFGEYHGKKVAFAVLMGFAGMLLIYKPVMHLPWYYHLAGLISGITSAIAYMTVNRLAAYYDPRVIVLSFLSSGFLVPLITMLLHYTLGLQTDGLFIIDFRWPAGAEWGWLLLMGLAALFGQYFVTRSFGSDKAGIVSVFGYANIIYSVFIGMLLGDAFPDWISWAGIFCIIGSGVIITLVKRKKNSLPARGPAPR